MFGLIKRWRRGRVMAGEFPSAWQHHLQQNCGFYARFPAADRDELKRKMLVFLDEKHFEGCRGVVIDDEIRVTIAAHACLLLLHRKTDFYRHLVTILVYPSTFIVKVKEVDEHGFEWDEHMENAGESWDRGNVIVAWDVAKHGALDPRDGLNVLLHEFAHQLDAEGGRTEGAPVMDTSADRQEWARVMQAEYERLLDDIENDRDQLIDDYGATDPAEFFAVCVETFFEKPHQMQKHHPALYQQLSRYFRQDPAAWVPCSD
ncbi:MAG: zinc-dependent peptidase [Planctomycetes bacterium]|nr:zinc-dependent peptidase [Planctomycetota bacterium]